MNNPVLKKYHSLYRRHRFSVSVCLVLAAFIGLSITLILSGGKQIKPTDSHIVVLYADGKTLIVPSRAQTVGEFLIKNSIPLGDEDIVVPATSASINADEFSVQIVRAKSYVVYDGKLAYPSISAHEAPRLVAEAAGINLRPADTVTFAEELPDASSFIGRRVQITRAKQVLFTIYGKQEELYTNAETVGALLNELGVSPAVDDELSAPTTTVLINGDRLALNRRGVRVETQEVAIPQDTQYVTDSSLSFGATSVKEAGSPGKKIVTYEVTIQNDVEVSRREISSVTLEQPKTKVVARGSAASVIVGDKATLMAAAGIAPEDFAAVDYIIQKESGWRATATNPTSGAFGLCQSLPASKMASAGDDWQTNPVTQLKWCNGYAVGRYGGWQNSYQRWLIQNWW